MRKLGRGSAAAEEMEISQQLSGRSRATYNNYAMFSYDQRLLAVVRSTPQSVADVIQTMQAIGDICSDGDGLKWFNWLYLQVTGAVHERIVARGFSDPSGLGELDVQFAEFYFNALEAFLSGQPPPGCWQALFDRRDEVAIARIQFALAGINAHINHDLPLAIVKTCELSGSPPQHDSPQYADFTALNSTLESLVKAAKQKLLVRLLGDPLPSVSQLEDTIAVWSIVAAREAAWTNSEMLWAVRDAPALSARYMDMLDGITAVAGKALLVPIPLALAGAAEVIR